MVLDENNKVRQSTIVNINGFVWDVDIVPSESEALTIDGRQCRGATWCGQQRIVLSAMLNQRTARRTITHELSHAFLWSTQVHCQDTYGEEELCDFVACYAAQISRYANDIYTALFSDG